MRKTMLLAAMLSLTVLMFAASPALAAPDRSVSHDVEQEADSGDVDQSFKVTGGGDNSNQTVSTQGVANTGNAQNVIGVSDGFFDDEFFDDRFFNDRFFFGDFDGDGFDDGLQFEDVGASIEVSPEQVVTSDQEVNQAATATD
jgi:hypothetical protein